MDPFSPLNFILFSFGCNFFRKSLWTRVFGWILFTLHALKAFLPWIKLTRMLSRLYDDSVSQGVVTTFIWYLDDVFDCLFISIVVYNRNHYEDILRKLSDKLTVNERKSLWKLSLFGFLFSVSVPVKDLVSITQNNDRKLLLIIRNWLMTLSSIDSFLVCGRIVFCYFIRLVTFEDKRFIQSIVEQYKSLTPSSVSVEKRRLQEYRQFVVDKFFVIPVLWFLRELVMLVAVIADTRFARRNPTLFLLTGVMPAVTSIVAHAFMIFYIDHCVNDVNKELERVTLILAQKDYHKWRSIISEFEKENRNITTCSMIDINKRTGLSFISNLITLTLLFKQLVSSLH